MKTLLFNFLFVSAASFQSSNRFVFDHGLIKKLSCGQASGRNTRLHRRVSELMSSNYETMDVKDATRSSAVDKIKNELLDLGQKTQRGFRANSSEKKRARELVFELARFNPTEDAASPYYEHEDDTKSPLYSVEGNWTLVFTDAPDITTLDQNLFAELGRIGQECSRPYIKNVIEWKRPKWAGSLPFSGSEESRIIQKVITRAKADQSRPMLVDLRLAGLEVVTPNDDTVETSDLRKLIQQKGLLASIVKASPLSWIGPVDAPFGEFEILYVDDEMRVTKTGQNFIAVNTRIQPGKEWF